MEKLDLVLLPDKTSSCNLSERVNYLGEEEGSRKHNCFT